MGCSPWGPKELDTTDEPKHSTHDIHISCMYLKGICGEYKSILHVDTGDSLFKV